MSDRATDPGVAARIVVDPDVRHNGAAMRVLVTNDDGIDSPAGPRSPRWARSSARRVCSPTT